MLEFRNSEKSQLGLPLPKGKVKVYRRDVDGRGYQFVACQPMDSVAADLRLVSPAAMLVARDGSSLSWNQHKPQWQCGPVARPV